MTRPLLAALLLALLLAPACDGVGGADGDPEDVTSGALSDATSPYAADNFARDTTAPAPDAVAPIYPGHSCERDAQCSTGLCWGVATPQGYFQPKVCQTQCVPKDDFSKFCDSDADCCEGHCCVDCGWREGLCVKD